MYDFLNNPRFAALFYIAVGGERQNYLEEN
jgi:hypothetical protein